eukprot:GFUD01020399.1.p1 GENE.GFUD01020399.1~~GFUD01020399.1.p1  ORF type:complete len:473 (+),score=90.54 GFUD01020399.1:157-1419(+)
MVCFFPLLILGLLIPFLIIILIIILFVLMIPFLLLLFVYNLFATNISPTRSFDVEKEISIEELPPDLANVDAYIISGKEPLTCKQIMENLDKKGILDLHGRQKIPEDELKNVVFSVISLTKKIPKCELNMNDMRLNDSKLKILVPMASKFHTLKIGGEQHITKNGLETLRNYLCQSDNKSKLRRLEMHGTKVKSIQVVKKAIEEVDAFEGKEEKIELIDGISELLPYLQEVSLNRLLKYSAFDTITNEAENLSLWSPTNFSNLTSLSIRDCNITDSIVAKGVEGFLKIHTVDLSENPRITSKGWKEMSSKISQGNKLQHLIYQQGSISEASAKCLKDLLFYLTDLDLDHCRFEENSLQALLENKQNHDELSEMKIKRISLKDCSLKKRDQEAINDFQKGAIKIIHDIKKTPDNSAAWKCC